MHLSETRRNSSTAIFSYSLYYLSLPEAINESFCRNEQIHNNNTRQRKDLYPAEIKTKLHGEKTISFHGRTPSNNLHNHMKEISSLHAFKPKLKQCLHDKY